MAFPCPFPSRLLTAPRGPPLLPPPHSVPRGSSNPHPRASSNPHPRASSSPALHLSPCLAFLAPQAPHFVCSTSLFLTFFLALLAVPSLTGHLIITCPQTQVCTSTWPSRVPIPFQLLESWPCPHPHQPLQLCTLQSDLQICPRSLTLYLCSLVWLMRQKVSVPFIRDSQSWEILAENIGQAPHLFARKYPPWASLKS